MGLVNTTTSCELGAGSNEKFFIAGSKITIISFLDTVQRVIEWAEKREARYVCLANAHMIMLAYDSQKFWKTLNTSDLITPDGMSIVWSLRILGKKNQEQICGRDLTLSVCNEAALRKISVGFYGSSQKVLTALVTNLKQVYPTLDIAYVYSPPFRSLSSQEEEIILQDIKNSGISILFVGLGCPKQEYWMEKHKKYFSGVMIGIGAAFDFLSGFKPCPPLWMQKVGLEWFFRLCLEPRRLWYRNFWYSPRFVIIFIRQVLQMRF
ncbi:WecB/TagA/CpsF family glycosyltransferase [Scytonema sp. UIC 10036]|uniref:WecB/TagA/CpsF family glycosyltransferase n=1 Tax=Scytonema sp. UIC 10036 TaxID=2304196 RepID=UPI0012DAE695|nr:WecB/TagA/CpsF family glycosyltransferase [Scytonema sp. UIC 10036]MUG93012.1 WecB/TagA/CpsF family glycosyltransferase [Scytonema sp. UIC 10036]